jgi:hypothetical protein
VTVQVQEWHKRQENYVVASVKTRRPAMNLIVKLQEPGERPNRHFDAMAIIARRVRSQTPVPTFDVVAVDVTRRRWTWDYLIVHQLPGLTWSELYPRLDREARQEGQRQIGRAAAQLHALRFEAFGQIGAEGVVLNPAADVPGLMGRQGAATTDESALSRPDAGGTRDTGAPV